MLKTLRSLMAFSLAEGLVDVDPTATIKLKPAKDTERLPNMADSLHRAVSGSS
jgi:site-specific recombinase XerD